MITMRTGLLHQGMSLDLSSPRRSAAYLAVQSALAEIKHRRGVVETARAAGRAELAMHVPAAREAHPVGNTGRTSKNPTASAE